MASSLVASLTPSSLPLKPSATRAHRATTTRLATTTTSASSLKSESPPSTSKKSGNGSWVSPNWLTSLTRLLSPSNDDSGIPLANAKLEDVSDLLGGALFLPLFKWMIDYGPVYRLAAGPRDFVVVSDPAAAKHVLKNYGKYAKGLVSEVSEFLFGSGFAIAEGPLWTVRRRAVVPSLHKKYLSVMVDNVFCRCAERMVEKLKVDALNGAPVNMEEKFSQLTLDVIGLSLFNYDFDSLTSNSPVIEAVYTALKEAEARSTDIFPYWKIKFLNRVVPRQIKAEKAVALIRRTVEDLITSCKQIVEAEGEQIDGEDYVNEIDPSILRFLLASREEVKYYRDALGSFGRITAVNGRGNTLPAEWWMLYGMEAPNLRSVAVKVLSQTASAGGCERNWSTFNLIHSKRRNRLGEKKLNDLVFVHYNLRLKLKHATEGHDKDDYTDPIDLAYIFKMHDDDADEDVLQRWMDSNGAPVLDQPGGRPNENISQQMGADVGDFLARSGRITDPVGGLEGEIDAAVDEILSSSSKSKSQSKDDSGDDDDDDVGRAGPGGGGESNSGGSGGSGRGPQATRLEEGLQAGREYMERQRNTHGQFVPSPSPGPTDYEYGRGQRPTDSYMEDLTSSVGSLSFMDIDSPYRGGAQSPLGGYGSSHDERSFGVFPEYFQAPPPGPPPPPPQYAPPTYSYGYSGYGGYSSGDNYQSSQPEQSQGSFFGGDSYGFFPDYYTAVPPPPPQRSSPTPSSSSRGSQGSSSQQPRRATRDTGSSAAYPRLGMLIGIDDHQYRQYVMDYKAMYSYMTWENYCEFIESAMRYERQQGRGGIQIHHETPGSDQNMSPGQVSSIQLRDDLLSMLVAGHETTGSVMTWTSYLLSKNTSTLKKAQQEVDKVLQGRKPTFADIRELKYLTRCIYESMRLYPHPPVLIRRSQEADILPGNYKINAGQDIMISVYNIHHSPQVWEKAEEFIPERFSLDEAVPNETNTDFRFIPFSGGPRKCVGDQFALMEATVALAILLQNMDFKLVPDQKINMTTGATIHTTNGLYMTLSPREL